MPCTGTAGSRCRKTTSCRRGETMKRSAAVFVILLASAPNVVAQSDTQPPQFVGVSLASSTVDVTASAQTINFTVHAKDNLSGIFLAVVSLRSPSGIQHPFGFGFPS